MNTSEKGSDKEKRRKVDGKKIAEQKRQKFLLKQQKKKNFVNLLKRRNFGSRKKKYLN